MMLPKDCAEYQEKGLWRMHHQLYLIYGLPKFNTRAKRRWKAGNSNGKQTMVGAKHASSELRAACLPAVPLQPHFLADFGAWGKEGGHGLDHIQRPVFRHVPQKVPFPQGC